MQNTTNPTESLIPRSDVAGAGVAGAVTVLLLAALNYGDWSAVDWTAVAGAFTLLIQVGTTYLLPTTAKELVSGFSGALAVILVGLIQWATIGTPFDIASYAALITSVVVFLFNVVLPRLQPTT